jgi:hypothetical protein
MLLNHKEFPVTSKLSPSMCRKLAPLVSPRARRSAITTTIVKLKDRALCLIQLPVADNRESCSAKDHHNVVRKMVLKISGGLTDNLTADGE